jgi:hypothetical protein
VSIIDGLEQLRHVPFRRALCDAATDEPLFGRGCVFQETFLTTRHLYFGSEQILWFCKQEKFNEHEPKPAHMLPRPFHDFDLHGSKSHTPEELIAFWLQVATEYSRTTTSFPEDRLYAITGIARLLDERHWHKLDKNRKTYGAGMWRHNFIQQMGWCVQHIIQFLSFKTSLGMPPREYRAPSWSWASANVSVYFLGSDTELVLEADRGIDIIEGESPFSPSRSGTRIRLWANLCAFESVKTDKEERARHFLAPVTDRSNVAKQ